MGNWINTLTGREGPSGRAMGRHIRARIRTGRVWWLWRGQQGFESSQARPSQEVIYVSKADLRVGAGKRKEATVHYSSEGSVVLKIAPW